MIRRSSQRRWVSLRQKFFRHVFFSHYENRPPSWHVFLTVTWSLSQHSLGSISFSRNVLCCRRVTQLIYCHDKSIRLHITQSEGERFPFFFLKLTTVLSHVFTPVFYSPCFTLFLCLSSSHLTSAWSQLLTLYSHSHICLVGPLQKQWSWILQSPPKRRKNKASSGPLNRKRRRHKL